ncbi:uncharacterized protein [Dendrobates tinctorius]|uniref:uncharacterized protein isoform X2 n=1 Tax=Dendrobates tinctorius TaxID=92724 RepID=UPI003CCA2D53
MDLDRYKMAKKILHLTLEILFRLTGEDYTVVKKTSSERCHDPMSEGWGRPLTPITGPPPHPLLHEDTDDQKILELTYKMIELLTGEVPIRCQDVAVYFSMEEWEYLEDHRDLYKNVIMEVPQPLTSSDLSSKRTTPERCPRPLLPEDCKQEDPGVPQDHQVSTISDPLSEDLLRKRIFLIYPSTMDMDRNKMVEMILYLTLEILFRLTGEDYTVVKKTSSERCQDPVSEGWGRLLSPITGPTPHSLIHEDINEQKILELTYKMTELLTGEVPIRCQDVSVYFSMDEWEYLEDQRDLYKNVIMEVPQHLTSSDLSSKRTTPERCPHPLLPEDCKQEDPNVPQDHQGEDLTHINTTETYVKGDEWCKVEIPTDDYPDDCTRRSEGQLTSSIFKSDDLEILQHTTEVIGVTPDILSSIHSKDLSSDPMKQMSSDRQEFIRELIEMYRSLPCLWKIKSADYNNKYKKKEAYEKLVALFKQHNPSDTVDETVVKKKIQCLRTVYKKALNKVEKSTKSGAGTEEVYVPKLWYYDLMAFTRDQEIPRPMALMMPEEEEPEIRPDSPVGDEHCEALSTPTCGSDDIASTAISTEEASEEAAPSSIPRRLTSCRKRKTPISPSSEFIELAKKVLTQQNKPAVSGFAHYVDDKLCTLDEAQRMHAERVMLEALSKAATGKLTDTSSVFERNPGSQYSWTPIQEPLDSTPRRGIEPPQT